MKSIKKKRIIKEYKMIISAQRKVRSQRLQEVGNLSVISASIHDAYNQCIAVGKQHGLSDDKIDQLYYKALDELDREAGIYPDDTPMVIEDKTIRDLRKSWGMTRRELANYIGVSYDLVDVIERDERVNQESVLDLCYLIIDRYNDAYDRQ